MQQVRSDAIDIRKRLANQILAIQPQQPHVRLLRQIPGIHPRPRPPGEEAHEILAHVGGDVLDKWIGGRRFHSTVGRLAYLLGFLPPRTLAGAQGRSTV